MEHVSIVLKGSLDSNEFLSVWSEPTFLGFFFNFSMFENREIVLARYNTIMYQNPKFQLSACSSILYVTWWRIFIVGILKGKKTNSTIILLLQNIAAKFAYGKKNCKQVL